MAFSKDPFCVLRWLWTSNKIEDGHCERLKCHQILLFFFFFFFLWRSRPECPHPEGIPGSWKGSGACLKCFYTNTCSVRSKQGGAEAVRSQSCDSISISETRNESRDWSAGTECYRLSMWGGGVALGEGEFWWYSPSVSDDVAEGLADTHAEVVTKHSPSKLFFSVVQSLETEVIWLHTSWVFAIVGQ